MPNKFGQAYALTILSPIAGGHTHGTVHATEIRAALNRIGHNDASPLAKISTLHFARFMVLDDVRIEGEPAKEDHLHSKYLVFVADFDGELPAFLETLRNECAEFVTSVWQYCEAFPGTQDSAAFRQYFGRCQITSTFPFGAYADTPLPSVLRALETQRRMIGFLERTQGAPAPALQQAFRAFEKEILPA